MGVSPRFGITDPPKWCKNCILGIVLLEVSDHSELIGIVDFARFFLYQLAKLDLLQTLFCPEG